MFKKINRKNKKGFTLAELLIVVAIIGVLVAVSIPIFTSQLEKSKEATDLANIRAAYAEAASEAITTAKPASGDWKVEKETASNMQSTGAIDQVSSQECGPWTSSKITITPGSKAKITGTTTDGVNWTWSLSGGASVSTT